MISFWHSSPRVPNFVLFGLIAIPVLASIRPARIEAQRNGNAQDSAWSVEAWSAKGFASMPEACHPLAYFSGSPLHFDYGDDLFQMSAASFTYVTHSSLVGVVQGRHVFQVFQQVQPKGTAVPGGELSLKRIVVERQPGQFCMIFQEQGPVGPSGTLVRIDPAKLLTLDGQPVLYTHDPVTGNGGAYVEEAWTFTVGKSAVPISLFDEAHNEVPRTIEAILPAGCAILRGEPLDLADLKYQSPVWKESDNMADPTCGSVALTLGIKDNHLIVLSRQYTP